MPKNSSLKSLLQRIQMRLAKARFLTFSALLHLIIVLLAGSVVLIRNADPQIDFKTGGEGGIFSPDTSEPLPPPRDPPSADPAEFTPVAPVMPPPNVTAILNANPAPRDFQIVASAPTQQLGSRLSDVEKRISESVIGKGGASIGKSGGSGSFFGQREETVGALTGAFYDIKQTRSRQPSGATVEDYSEVVKKFVGGGWRESMLKDYFKAAKPLYSTQIFIPNMSATEGPRAFDLSNEVQPSRWLVHYRGRVAAPTNGTFRFVGAGDDYMVVRFNSKLVLDHGFHKATAWQPDCYYDYGWTRVPKGFARGDKFTVRAGEFYDMEVLIGEQPGGSVFFCLMLEDQGEEYAKDGRGNPILPVFRLADTPFPELTKGQTLPPFAMDGPIWRAATSKGGSALDGFFRPN